MISNADINISHKMEVLGMSNFLNIFDSTMLALSALFTGITCFATFRIYNAQLKQHNNQKLPNLKLLSVNIKKSHRNLSSLSDGSYCRIFNGQSEDYMKLNQKIAVFSANDPKIEDGFIEEIKANINTPNAYFTYFESNVFLIANHATNIDAFIVEHSNVKMKFHNYGALISCISIKSLIVFYKPNMNLEKLIFYGNEKNIITLSPEQNKDFVVYFDEVTTNLNNSLCQIHQNLYEIAPDSFNLLTKRMPENILTYNKLELNLNCWDLYNNKNELKISIEHNGCFFVTSTSLKSA